jgi:hypothetical protein
MVVPPYLAVKTSSNLAFYEPSRQAATHGLPLPAALVRHAETRPPSPYMFSQIVT